MAWRCHSSSEAQPAAAPRVRAATAAAASQRRNGVRGRKLDRGIGIAASTTEPAPEFPGRRQQRMAGFYTGAPAAGNAAG
jgi:hypothetical protein